MGIGNTTPATAIIAAFTGRAPSGGDRPGHRPRRRRPGAQGRGDRAALAVNRPDPADGLDVLAKVGGFEIGAMAGAMLAAAAARIPVVVDGFISTAGGADRRPRWPRTRAAT